MNAPIMSFYPHIIRITIAALCLSHLPAQAPRKTPKDVYQYLAWRSPFTANRHTQPPKVPNYAENLAITGFTKFPEGYFVTLAERSDPAKTHIIQPGIQGPIEIIEVYQQHPNLTLKIKYLGATAEIGFDTDAVKKKITQPNKNQLIPAGAAPRLVVPTPQ